MCSCSYFLFLPITVYDPCSFFHISFPFFPFFDSRNFYLSPPLFLPIMTFVFSLPLISSLSSHYDIRVLTSSHLLSFFPLWHSCSFFLSSPLFLPIMTFVFSLPLISSLSSHYDIRVPSSSHLLSFFPWWDSCSFLHTVWFRYCMYFLSLTSYLSSHDVIHAPYSLTSSHYSPNGILSPYGIHVSSSSHLSHFFLSCDSCSWFLSPLPFFPLFYSFSFLLAPPPFVPIIFLIHFLPFISPLFYHVPSPYYYPLSFRDSFSFSPHLSSFFLLCSVMHDHDSSHLSPFIVLLIFLSPPFLPNIMFLLPLPIPLSFHYLIRVPSLSTSFLSLLMWFLFLLSYFALIDSCFSL